jgi:MFS family permease
MPAPPPPGRLRLILRAFKHRNYRLFFIGQGVSLVGSWMQQVALAWLVYRLTNSPFLLGLVAFLSQAPGLFITPFAGVLADRRDRRRILYATQGLAMAQAGVLTALAYAGALQAWHLPWLALWMGIVNAVDIPTRQAFLLDLVEDRDDLPNAIALNSSLFNSARLVGPALASALIAAWGEGACFLINTLSYAAVLAALAAMRLAPRPRTEGHPPVLEGLKEGVRYAYHFTPIRSILLLLAATSLMGMPLLVLLPVLAREAFGGGVHTFGFLMTGFGSGALAGAVYLASRRSVVGLGRWTARASLIFSLALIALAFTPRLGPALVLLAAAGFGMMVLMASSNTLLQTLAEEGMRGRVMSLYTLSFMGVLPFGSLLAGALAGPLGAVGAVLLGGTACLAAGLAFRAYLPRFRAQVRPLYVEMGIIREVAAALENADEPGTGEQR